MTNRFASRSGSPGKDLVVAVALVWAALIVAVSGALHATPYADHLLSVLAIAAIGCAVIVAAGVKAMHG